MCLAYHSKAYVAGKKIVKITAHCATCTVNEGFQLLLKVIVIMIVYNLVDRRCASVTLSVLRKPRRRSIDASKERRVELGKSRKWFIWTKGRNNVYVQQNFQNSLYNFFCLMVALFQKCSPRACTHLTVK